MLTKDVADTKKYKLLRFKKMWAFVLKKIYFDNSKNISYAFLQVSGCKMMLVID